MTLLPGEKISLEAHLEKLEKVEKENELNKKKNWTSRKVYQYSDPDNPENNKILGFGVSDDFAVAVTHSSLVCFSSSGTLLWEKKFGQEKRLLFDSLPYIDNSTLYLSTNDKLLVIDIRTGKERFLDASGIVSDGYGFTLVNNILYIPYPDGIYQFNTKENILDPLPLIHVNNPATPLVLDKGMYITSTISNTISLFSLSGESMGEYSMNTISTCSPVMIKGFIIAGDRSGTLYKFSLSLEIKQTLQIESGITSLIADKEHLLYIFTEKGVLYSIDPDTFKSIKKIQVDKIPDPGVYFYKHPELIDSEMFIGTEHGTIFILDRKNGLKAKEIKVSDHAIHCSLYKSGDVLFTGTKNGEIIILQ